MSFFRKITFITLAISIVANTLGASATYEMRLPGQQTQQKLEIESTLGVQPTRTNLKMEHIYITPSVTTGLPGMSVEEVERLKNIKNESSAVSSIIKIESSQSLSSTNSTISNNSSTSSQNVSQDTILSPSSESIVSSSLISSTSSNQNSSQSSSTSSSQGSSVSSSSSSTSSAVTTDKNLKSILDKRLPSGAITTYNSNLEIKINPYFQNLAVCGLASEIVHGTYPNKQELIDTGWKALDWYKSKQDPNTGYIYDHSVKNGVETSIGNMDSVDAYVGTYFLAIDCMYKATGDTTKLQSYQASMLKAKQAINTIYDPADKLYIAKPEWQVKYLMDNLELARGIKQSASLFKALGMNNEANQAQASFDELTQAIETRFWNNTNQDYYWAIAGKIPQEVIYTSDWSKCYADAKANVWSATWLNTNSNRQTQLNLKFDRVAKDILDTKLVQCKWNPFVAIGMANGGQTNLAQSYYDFGQSAISDPKLNIGGIYTTGHDGMFLILKYKLQGKNLIL
jgi:hypothetical protein